MCKAATTRHARSLDCVRLTLRGNVTFALPWCDTLQTDMCFEAIEEDRVLVTVTFVYLVCIGTSGHRQVDGEVCLGDRFGCQTVLHRIFE